MLAHVEDQGTRHDEVQAVKLAAEQRKKAADGQNGANQGMGK